MVPEVAAMAAAAGPRLHITTFGALLFATLVPSIILHEVSHGAVAFLFGDTTARDAGRLSLNPVKHIDPFGSLILPAIMVLSGFGAFGYAKPVPVQPSRMRNPRNHGLLTSLAGPATNLVIAAAATLLLRLFLPHEIALLKVGVFPASWAARVLFVLGFGNVILAAFNLIPLPPLDGSAVFERLMPRQWWPQYLRFRQYSMLIVFGFLFILPSVTGLDPVGRLFRWVLELWVRVL